MKLWANSEISFDSENLGFSAFWDTGNWNDTKPQATNIWPQSLCTTKSLYSRLEKWKPTMDSMLHINTLENERIHNQQRTLPLQAPHQVLWMMIISGSPLCRTKSKVKNVKRFLGIKDNLKCLCFTVSMVPLILKDILPKKQHNSQGKAQWQHPFNTNLF